MTLKDHLQRRWRLLAASLAGVFAGLFAPTASDVSSALIGWDAASLVYLAATWHVFLTDDHGAMRRLASVEDESRGMILTLIVSVIVASLGAVAWTLVKSTSELPLAIATVTLSWAVLHSVFVLHYAHRFFDAAEDDRSPGKGLDFPGKDELRYSDFVYFSFCIGMTFQASDVDVTTRRMRNLVTMHAILSYFFYTFVLALTINLLSGLVEK